MGSSASRLPVNFAESWEQNAMRPMEVLIEKRGVSNTILEDILCRDWYESLGRNGLKVDGVPFFLGNRQAQCFLDDLIPSQFRRRQKNQAGHHEGYLI